jgi:hypothetical protein
MTDAIPQYRTLRQKLPDRRAQAGERQSVCSITGSLFSTRRSPQGLRPEVARIIEELARAAVRREDRRDRRARQVGA